MARRKPPGEKFYDKEIAPALMALAKKCEAEGLSFFAAVNFGPEGEIGRTVSLREGSPFMLRMLDALARCWCEGGTVNVDAFLIALSRHAREHGHSSMFLSQLGIPTEPETVKP